MKSMPKTHAVALGRKGGKARAASLSREELSKQGRKAVIARWAKSKKSWKTSARLRFPPCLQVPISVIGIASYEPQQPATFSGETC